MELHFLEEYENTLMLIEVPDSIAETIKNKGDLIIKGGDQTILCSNEKSYELKYVETSNTFLLLSNPAMQDGAINENRKDITLMTNHSLECVEYTPRKFTVYNILKQECSLNYIKETGEDNFHQFERKLSLGELFAMSELCDNDFSKMVDTFGIFERNGYACVHNESFLYSIIDDILVMLSKENLDYERISVDQVFSERLINQNNLYSNFLNSLSESEKNSILRNIFDPFTESDENNSITNSFYKLNTEKVKLFCAKNIFHLRKEANFKLEDFVSLLKNMLFVSLPYQIVDQMTLQNLDYAQTAAEDNVFEGFKDFDLRFLKGYCVIYFLKTQRDALIK